MPSLVEYFMSIGAGFRNLNSDRDDPSVQRRERFVLGEKGDHVACAMEM
jgi:hypothetical protein